MMQSQPIDPALRGLPTTHDDARRILYGSPLAKIRLMNRVRQTRAARELRLEFPQHG
jgi:hypothetical protein